MQTIDRNNEKQYHDDGGDKTEEPRDPTDTEAFNALEDDVYWAMYVTFDNFHVSFYISVQILLKI